MKGSPGKAPTTQWYFKDWLSDRHLQACSAASRGIWINLLMYMYDCSFDDNSSCENGVIVATVGELSRLGSCTTEEAEAFLFEALRHPFCNIENEDGSKCRPEDLSLEKENIPPKGMTIYTHGVYHMGGRKVDSLKIVRVISRRIKREHDRRLKWRKDKRKQREREADEDGCPSDVSASRARPIPIPIPIPTSKNKKKLLFLDEDSLKNNSMMTIEKGLAEICQTLRDEKIFGNVRSFVTQSIQDGQNKRAILHALQKTYDKKEFRKGPWSYANKILKVENGNYNENEHGKSNQ